MSDQSGDRRAEIAETLRGRILRGLHAGTLRQGDRLPSAREVEAEMGVDHRVILDAYRALAAEALVELRPRGGIYVTGGGSPGSVPVPSEVWLVDTLAQGVAREIAATELHEWMRRAVETLRLRAVVVQGTADQIAGLCRELRDDYGLDASGVEINAVRAEPLPPEVRYADLVVTTEGYADEVRSLAARLDKPCVVAEVRPDLVGGEWRLLLNRPVYVIVHDARFVPTLLSFFASIPGAENVRPLVLGRDDLDQIPDGAPTYVTRSARGQLGDTPIRGRILPSARLLSAESTREILRFVVRANLDVIAARGR